MTLLSIFLSFKTIQSLFLSPRSHSLFPAQPPPLGIIPAPFICHVSFITDSFLNIHACVLHTSLQQRLWRASVQHALCLAVDGQWGTNHLIYTSLRRRWTMKQSVDYDQFPEGKTKTERGGCVACHSFSKSMALTILS